MGDLEPRGRRRPAPVATGLTASARILAPTIHDAPQGEPWHPEAWAMRRTTGEVRFAELWLANSMRQVKLIPAYRPDPKGDPVPIEDGPAVDLIAALGGGVGGQASIMAAFATQLLTPGVGYLLGQPGIDNAADWQVVSANQVRLSPRRDPVSNLPLYELREGDEAQDWRVLEAGSLPVKVWRPDPEYSYRPDSPVNGALPILRELSLLTQHVEAQATSRLAGAGIFAMDAALEFEGGWEAWLNEFLSTIVKPIHDRSVPAAVAPFPVKFPLAKGEKIADKIAHLMFATPFDEQSLQLRAEAIGRCATAMDMPTRMLLGEAENHWGDWHTSEQGIKLHIEPDSQIVCEGITKGYLTPGLKAIEARSSLEDPGMGRVIQLRDAPPPLYEGHEVFCWYDASSLGQRPDVSEHAQFAYDRFEVDGNTLRRESGLDDQPPEAAELERQVWLAMLKTDMAPLALLKLGYASEQDLKVVGTAADGAVQPPPAAGEPEAPAPEAEPQPAEQAPPDRDQAPDGPPTQAPGPPARAAGVDQALVAAADGLVYRALEKAGNRLRQRLRRATSAAPDVPAVRLHLTCNATAVVDADSLLVGAWDRVPEVAEQLGVDAELLRVELDTYVRQLLRTRHGHTWALLEAFLAGRSQALETAA